MAVVAGGVVAADQLTKWWALERLDRGPVDLVLGVRLALSFNSGAAFGIGTGFSPFLAVAAVALIVVLLALGRTVVTPVAVVGLGLVLGGAAGNLSDRVFRDHGGAVVDFVDVGWWPVFNLADAAITVGAILMVLGWRERRPGPS